MMFMAKSITFNSSDYTSKYDPIFKDTPYWDTYQGIVNQYKDGVPFNWWRSLTGQDSSDLYNHKMAYQNAINGLLEQMRVDNYNSPANQVALERQAGLNPDLIGVSGTGATSPTDTVTPEPMLYENPIPHMVSFLSMIGGAVSGAQSMISQNIVNDGLRLQNLKSINDIALTELGRSDISLNTGDDIFPAFSLGFNTGNRSLDKKLEGRAKSFYGSIAHKIATKSNTRDLAKVRKEAFDITSSAGYSDDDDFYSGLAVRMADAYQKLIDMSNSLDMKEITERSEYLDNFDSSEFANSQNQSHKRSSNRDKQWNEFISIQHGMIGYIREQAKEGNTGAIELLFRIFGENSDINGPLMRFGTNVGFGIKHSNPFN